MCVRVVLGKVNDGHCKRKCLVLYGWVLHLVQVVYEALFCVCTSAGGDSVHSEAGPGLCVCVWVGSGAYFGARGI